MATRRFIADLFDKIVWSPESMDRIDEVGGLDLCFPIPPIKKIFSKEVINSSSKNTKQDKVKGVCLTSVKIIKGFEPSLN